MRFGALYKKNAFGYAPINTRYTRLSQFEHRPLTTVAVIDVHTESERTSGGISADGLLAMYEHMGLDCLARDMKALGIPRDTAEQQLASVRHTVQHLTALEAKVKVN